MEAFWHTITSSLSYVYCASGVQEFCSDIKSRNLLSSARAVSNELMSPMAMFPVVGGTDGNVTEFLGVVSREELWDKLWSRPGLKVPDMRLE